MHIGIHIAENTLSDGSHTYDVVIQPMLKSDGTIRLPAVTLRDADAFAAALQDLIVKHSLSEVTYDDPETFGTY